PAAADPVEQVRRCKILDFGLARPVDAAAAQLTAGGAVLGTPAYMAPEQARGEVVDARADLFSLGVTLYRMVAGRPPFDGSTPMAVLVALATESPPPVREAAPAVPPALADLIDRLVAKDREHRPQSAVEVVAAVRRIADHPQPAQALDTAPAVSESSTLDVRDIRRPVGPSASRPHRAGRGRAPLVLGAIGLLALAGTGVWLAAGGLKPVAEVTTNDDAPGAGAQVKVEPAAEPVPEKRADPKAQPPRPAPPPPAGDPDRKAALWVLSVKGAVLVDGVPEQIREARRLPKEPFRLTEVYLTVPVPDAALAVFADCKDITIAYLAGTRITNAGLAHLANCTNLADLSLPGTRVDDAVVPAIARFTKLTDLSIGETGITAKGALELAKALPSCRIQYGATFDPATDDDRAAAEFVLSAGGKVGVNYAAAETGDAKLLPPGPFRLTAVNLTGRPGATDAELDRFRECKSLTRLTLTGTPVTDAGLGTAQGFSKLTHLDLRGTKVTARGAAAVARSLPECEVAWDGGVIRPKR
ncbi:protein kinase, partial [bacterium]|nr:protein kinase [bacterium]